MIGCDNIISSYDVVFDESFSSELLYISQPYKENLAMRPSVSYITYAIYLKEKTGDVITFAQFEEGDLLSKACNDTESGNKYDDCSTLATLICEEEMDEMSSLD